MLPLAIVMVLFLIIALSLLRRANNEEDPITGTAACIFGVASIVVMIWLMMALYHATIDPGIPADAHASHHATRTGIALNEP